MKTIDFYFDFLSPFSFFAFENLKIIRREIPFIWHFSPLPLAKILNHWGTQAPANIPPKRDYLFKYCMRYATQNHITFTAPKIHPFNPLYTLRLATKSCSGSKQFELIDALFRAGWQRGVDLGDPDEIQKALVATHFSHQAVSNLMEKSFSLSAKAELKTNLKKAKDRGVFGVPTLIVDHSELFWGNDSLNHLKDYLLSRDPLNADEFTRIKDATVVDNPELNHRL